MWMQLLVVVDIFILVPFLLLHYKMCGYEIQPVTDKTNMVTDPHGMMLKPVYTHIMHNVIPLLVLCLE